MDNKVIGGEGIIISNGDIILGMQKSKRWCKYKNGNGALVKTIGGQIEEEDFDSEAALIREISEEIKNININSTDKNVKFLFKKSIKMGQLNPFLKESALEMTADFFAVEVNGKIDWMPFDLPFLIKIPINVFLTFDVGKIYETKLISKYLIKNENIPIDMPEYFTFFVPKEVKEYLREIMDE